MSEQRVFISYSRGDRPLAESAIERLRASDLRSARIDDPPYSVSAGEDARSIITDKIRQADTFVLLWSDQAAKSPWVQYEVGIAEALGLPIRVFLVGGSRAKVPMGLADTAVVRIESAKPDADASASDETNASISTALESLTLQSQKLQEQIQEVHTMLAGRSAKAASRTAPTPTCAAINVKEISAMPRLFPEDALPLSSARHSSAR